MIETQPENAFPSIQSNRYTILAVLGSGAVGTVYKANDSILDKVVAIKKLHKSAADAEAVRFHREAKLAGTLKHPNVLSVLDFGLTENDEPYLVLNFVEGVSLDQRIDTDGPLHPNEAMPIFIQIARGLVHAHNKNVIHRDIKPSNIMLVENAESISETVRIVDFGLAKSTVEGQELTKSGVGVGTPMFMSPEQIRGDDVDARSDIYSFGCLMYEVLTGHKPFETDQLLELIEMKLNEEALPVNELAPWGMPDSLGAIVHRCLERDRDDRYENALALLSALEAVEVHEPETEIVPNVVPKTGLLSKINWRQLSIVLCVLLAAVVPLVVVAFLSSPVAEKPRKHKSGDISKFIPGEGNPNFFRADNVTDSDLKAFIEVHQTPINELLLRHSKLTNKGLLALRNVNIGVLALKNSDVPINAGTYKSISKIKSLTLVRLHDNQSLDFRGISALKNLPLITELDIHTQTMDENSLKEIGRLTNLNRLEIQDVSGIGGDRFKHLKSLTKLRTVFLGGSDADDETIEQFIGMPLTYISLDLTLITNKTLQTLLRLPALQKVSLVNCDHMNYAGVQAFNDNQKKSFSIIWKREELNPNAANGAGGHQDWGGLKGTDASDYDFSP